MRQKWIILLSKSRGGVDKIPKAFLNSIEPDQASVKTAETTATDFFNLRQAKSSSKSDEQPRREEAAAAPAQSLLFKKLLGKSSNSKRSSFKSSHSISSQLEQTNLIRMPSNKDLNESTSAFQSNISETFDFDQHNVGAKKPTQPQIQTHITADVAAAPVLGGKSSKQMLSTLIELRRELKTESEDRNLKIEKIDKKIAEMLAQFADFNCLSMGLNKSASSVSVSRSRKSNLSISGGAADLPKTDASALLVKKDYLPITYLSSTTR